MFAIVQNSVELFGWEPAVPGVAWRDGGHEREASSRICNLDEGKLLSLTRVGPSSGGTLLSLCPQPWFLNMVAFDA